MKIQIHTSTLTRDKNGELALEMTIGEGAQARVVIMPLKLSEDQLRQQMSEPVALDLGPATWIYRNRFVTATDYGTISEELLLRVKHRVLSEEKALEKLRREVQAFERFEQSTGTSRTPIPDEVRLFVWQRDGGRCVKCAAMNSWSTTTSFR